MPSARRRPVPERRSTPATATESGVTTTRAVPASVHSPEGSLSRAAPILARRCVESNATNSEVRNDTPSGRAASARTSTLSNVP